MAEVKLTTTQSLPYPSDEISAMFEHDGPLFHTKISQVLSGKLK